MGALNAVLRAGIASDAISREATKQRARLVVMGSRSGGKPAAERTGLVVIGLRLKSRPQPGAIASAVLRNKSAFVLAVPEAAS
jgi:hypothetical protein